MNNTDRYAARRSSCHVCAWAAFAMLFALGQAHTARAQWTTSGSNINSTNTGNVGVGTNAPGAKLDVVGPVTGSGPTIRAAGGGDVVLASGGSLFFDGNYEYVSGNYIRPLAPNTQSFFTSGLERMRISAAGNVGIGTVSPGSLLHVDANFPAAGTDSLSIANRGVTTKGHAAGLRFQYNSAVPAAVRARVVNIANGAGDLGFFTSGDGSAANLMERLTIQSGGSVGIGTTTPIGSLHVPYGRVVIGQNYYEGATLSVGRADANYPGIVTATNFNDGGKPIFRARSFGPTSATGEGIYNFLGQRDDTTRTFSADYAGNGYFAGSLNAVGGLCINGECKTSWSQVGGANQWSSTASGINYSSGNVGVGVASPTSKLHVVGPVTGNGPTIRADGGGDVVLASGGSLFFDGNYEYVSGNYIRPLARNTQGFFTSGLERMRISAAGNVGIGTTAPTKALHVVGDVEVTGNISAKYQDVAEWVPTSQKLLPGTVVVLDPARSNHVLASASAYDTSVAGVVSAQPGIILGEAGEGKVKVATTGRVKVKVDATKGAIKIGDLLVTSDVPGMAIKSEPLELGGAKFHRPGTIIGKALESLEKGVGEILVLLSLQ